MLDLRGGTVDSQATELVQSTMVDSSFGADGGVAKEPAS